MKFSNEGIKREIFHKKELHTITNNKEKNSTNKKK